MTQKKKRPNLSAFTAEKEAIQEETHSDENVSDESEPKYIHKSLYIPPEVADQLDLLAIQERPARGRKKKINSLVLEGINLLLKDRGLPSIEELTKKT